MTLLLTKTRAQEFILPLVILVVVGLLGFEKLRGEEWDTLEVYGSTEVSTEGFFKQLELKQKGNRLHLELLKSQREQLAETIGKHRRLRKKGHRLDSEIEGLSLRLNGLDSHIVARSDFGELVGWVRDALSGTSFVDPPNSASLQRAAEEPEFRVRLPGLTLRQGGMDFFTVRLPAKAATTRAVAKYNLARLLQTSHRPHSSPYLEYVVDRQVQVEQLPSSRSSELERSAYLVSTANQLQEITNQRFRYQVHKGQQSFRFDDYVKQIGKDKNTAEAVQTYSGSVNGFWLFGDGGAVASSDSAIAVASVAMAETKAVSKNDERQTAIQLKRLKRHHHRLEALRNKGYSSAPELRKSKLNVELAELELKANQAQAKVADLELAQLKIAAQQWAGKTRLVQLPDSNQNDHWKKWLTGGPPIDAADLIRFLDLAENLYLAEAEITAAEFGLAFERKQLSRYQKIKSLRPVERETQELLLANAEISRSRAIEQADLKKFELQQWAQRVHGPIVPKKSSSPEILSEVMTLGKQAALARAEVARVNLARCRLMNEYDRDYLSRLRGVQRKGAASTFEIARAANRERYSRGSLLSSRRKVALAEQEAVFLEILYQHGGLSFEREGFEFAHFTPEAIEALSQLTILREGIDDGKILQYDAALSNVKLMKNELQRLMGRGYASPEELKRLTVREQDLENRRVIEFAREEILDQALAVVQSLQDDSAEEQKTKTDPILF